MSQRKRSKGLGSSQMTDGEEDFSPSQVERYSQDQVNQKVSELVQFLLVKDQKKMPIKKADMLKSVFGKYRSCKEYKDFYSEIVNKAGRTLQEVFGLQLVEIDTKCPTYILINNLPRAEGKYPCRDKEKEKMGLLLVILSFIFMKGNSVKDSALWEFLNLLRVYPGYLEMISIPLTDPREFKFQWGPRAEKETSKKDVLNFVAKIQGKDPTFWASQYSEAQATP
ncbi:non-structural maintenance of chromosomes element 3 homolog isoform X3 [Corvus hawaiiensis]|uniref:non-structural maintenance of chromosomes element 3 homolog isoform X3 n=1 Tax=Corvus brachyrhynchos TaxID=85066 RepID=UPI00081661DE|nr:PREDICTED: non-structural maintenance of chromosomes element 3 homolog isoform X3 [Corvus brachyrhynchos]XP_048149127.1 non-structural maintenance of chromosomes element 3 homolog isoform X3 [Corvus hawaiiensis]